MEEPLAPEAGIGSSRRITVVIAFLSVREFVVVTTWRSCL